MRRTLLLALAVLASGTAGAAPYRPTDPSAVLERLPAGPSAARLRGAVAAHDLDLALTLARSYLLRGREQGDPRLLGYAEALLRPWYDDPAPPVEVLVLRATLRQGRHEFDAALADLDRVLARAPETPQAWLTRATVLRVQGRLAEAAEACARLAVPAAAFVARSCSASIDGLRGQGARALASFAGLEVAARQQPAPTAAWYHAEYADLLARTGDGEAALGQYALARALAPQDLALRLAEADLLLDLGRARELLQLLPEPTGQDGLDLRHALAQAALATRPHELIERLGASFAAAERRGDGLHLRDAARFRLSLGGDASGALELALRNWTSQREPADARLVLAAALAAGRPTAARPVLRWLEASGLEDRTLAALRQRLQAEA